jgi:iron-sulfur cluster assembly protein
MAVLFTEKAASEIKRVMQDQKCEPNTFVRIRLAGGGCSGFQYGFGLDTNFDEKTDTKAESHGVTVVVDRKSDLFLDGTTVDYYDGLEKRGFTFENPNATKTCGCGSSFSA